MSLPSANAIWQSLFGPQFLWWVVCGGFALMSIALLVMMMTNWGQSRPLHKCAALSLLAHLLFACFAASVQIVQAVSLPDEPSVRVSSIDGITDEDDPLEPAANQRPWYLLPAELPTQPTTAQLDRAAPEGDRQLERSLVDPDAALPGELPLADFPSIDQQFSGPDEIPSGEKAPAAGTAEPAAPIETPQPKHRASEAPLLADGPVPDRPEAPALAKTAADHPHPDQIPASLLEQTVTVPRMSDAPTTPTPQSSLSGLIDDPSAASSPRPAEAINNDRDLAATSSSRTDENQADRGEPGEAAEHPEADGVRLADDGSSLDRGQPTAPGSGDEGQPKLVPVRRGSVEPRVPELYRHRISPDRARIAQENGATPESEDAVSAALRWLAENQSPDGRWDPVQHEGGRELRVLGHDRQNAGIGADSGITGLALLAFLGAGHTHTSGDFTDVVRRGIEYLLSVQAPDGSLAGDARIFAAMYCHGMAMLALSETYAMTGDRQLEAPLRKALEYTLSAQHTTDGGWRYKPLERGDMSQFGWQLMAIKSAELAGIPIPEAHRQRMIRFLRNASSGPHGGLASYRPGERVSRVMTAEALVCRLFLGSLQDDPACREAVAFVAQELPGEGAKNLYYWYYATLGLYQMQGEPWQQWNHALQQTLVAAQRRDGRSAGSWDPDTVWGGYGGRVYSTAMSALCLEVYYRFLPLYVQTVSRESPESTTK